MKKMSEKSELKFAIILIVVYVVGQSIVQRVSAAIQIQFLAQAVFNILMAAVLLVFICCMLSRCFRKENWRTDSSC